nr:S-layer homology domain-containing protein [Ammoniphilus resinae]
MENTVSFGFQRFYNGIPVEGDTVNLTLNAKGQLVRLYTNQTTDLAGKVKGLSAKVSKEEATKRYLKDTSVQLNFLRIGEPWSPEGNANSDIKLVYQQTFKDGLHGGFAIDAIDGKWKSGWDPSGDAEHQGVEPKDIKGHWAETSLQTLIRYQIIKPDEKGNVNPDHAITRGEWLDMMVKAVDPYYDQVYIDPQAGELFDDVKKDHAYYPAARWARERDWIDAKEKKLGLDQVLTRENLAVSLTHIVKYDKLAKFMGAEEVGFADASQIKAKGAVSIITRLGLMKGVDGKFNPSSQVTKAQAATVLMGLVELQGKTDSPIGQIRY